MKIHPLEGQLFHADG